MQSLARALKRGNAYLYWDQTTQSVQVMRKKGTDRRLYNAFMANRLPDAEQRHIENAPQPIRRYE